jgi:F-type H+-transporting ATPase subunit b
MLAAPLTLLAAKSRSFLITPNVGLMIWTIVVFVISLFILWRFVFPRIGDALDKRAKTIEGDIDAAAQTREAAESVLGEYRQRLQEARAQSDEIVQRARQAAETHEQEAKERGREIAAEATTRAEREIEVATQRALGEIRKEVANLTILATEKVTRKVLDDADQKRLVEDALGELDFSGISTGATGD